jgi:hypothetical protein
MKRLLTSDPLTGIETWFHKDGSGFQLETTQDVSAILDQNKAMQGEGIRRLARAARCGTPPPSRW